jgi:hypothetical protein
MTTKQNRPPMGSRQSGTKRSNHRKHTANRSNRQPVYGSNGRVIGQICGDTFCKRADGSRHMLQKPRGWAVDACVLDDVQAHGVTTVQVTDRESQTVYTASLPDFECFGVRIDRSGYGAQICLPLDYWSIDGQPPQLGAARKPENATSGNTADFHQPLQLTLSW